MPTLAQLKVPPRLKAGDTVAVVSPSWGGPATFPHRFEAGVRQLEAGFGLKVVTMPHALRPAAWLKKNPKARADDLMAAFADPAIKGIFASIGGDDSVRLFEHMDLAVIRKNPKVYSGYSDTTATHLMCLQAGVRSYYGPAVMVEFAENGGMHTYTEESVRRTLFSSAPIGPLPVSARWTDQRLDWADPANQSIRRTMRRNAGLRVLQGKGVAEGRAIALCADLFPMLAGTPLWPAPALWNGAVLFLETSEDKPKPSEFTYWLRNMGVQGIFRRLAGLVLARPIGALNRRELHQYDVALQAVVRDEFNQKTLPLFAQADFGHTAPQFVIPYGIPTRLDCKTGGIHFLEAGVR